MYDDWLPRRSVMIRGRALATTVDARMATNIPAIRPDIAWTIWRFVMDGDAWGAGVSAADIGGRTSVL
ncbi:hypothetical protein GCM10010249_09110 [Streptomyces roseolilacinus]|uniref:Uncharacterized protein n=1 Tax=Streptomyces roseolilacinus TaxID=66904 RepID=A0A918EJR4_9ACTN|nr:hypothetical protein GCM10010249_09110 [Streptomyces roseolilacinus]